MPGELGVSKSAKCDTFSLQCFDTVGWMTGRASGVGFWFVGGGDFTGALHDL